MTHYAQNGNLMPSWWSPERRFAWRVTLNNFNGLGNVVSVFSNEERAKYVASKARSNNRLYQAAVERITAALETGEEVPA